jgi:hypothetical protein
MKCNEIVEHDDGSATLMLDLSKEEHDCFLELGIITAIKNGIDYDGNLYSRAINEDRK